MDSNEVWAECNECSAKVKSGDTQCSKCGSNNILFHKKVGQHSLTPRGRLRLRKKLEDGSKFVKEVVKGWFASRDSSLKEGVFQERIIDKEKDKYDQVVKNAETGKIIHEEHEPLSKHKGKSL